nr:Chain B, Peptide inhibitor (ASP-TYR-ASN-PRO-TYR-LEU-LEU-TYR-LEU-LYS) [synthetic construct]
DYNPYLLYLK